MWLARVSTRLAVVQWASSDGGSPRLATRSTPPFFWACAFQPVPATPNANATIATVNRSEALCVMRHLLEVLGGSCVRSCLSAPFGTSDRTPEPPSIHAIAPHTAASSFGSLAQADIESA